MIIGEEARRLGLVSALYAVLTFAMAYPLSASPGSTVVWDAPDTHVYLWTLAWDAYAFLHRPLLIFDANIYYPFTNTLAYSENLIGTAFVAAPIIWLTGNPVLGMNLAALIACMLCGVGAYVLARRWRLSPYAAFLCGLVFEFAPPRFIKLGQLHLTAIQWIPFTLAFLHSYLEHGKERSRIGSPATAPRTPQHNGEAAQQQSKHARKQVGKRLVVDRRSPQPFALQMHVQARWRREKIDQAGHRVGRVSAPQPGFGLHRPIGQHHPH